MKIKYSFILLFLFVLIFGIAGCGFMEKNTGDVELGDYGPAPDGGYYGDAIVGGITPSGDATLPVPKEGEGDKPIETQIPAGQLTSACYFDVDHFNFWQKLISQSEVQDDQGVKTVDGIFFNYAKKFVYRLNHQVKVTLSNNLVGKVELLAEDEKVIFSQYSNNAGVAYGYYSDVTPKYIRATVGEDVKTVEYQNEDEITIDFGELVQDKKEQIEIMFIIDTTGSMGDEISYLKVEIDDVIGKVKNANPEVKILLSLLFYRDYGDEYVTRYFDFSEDIEAQKGNLSQQYASGGGDFEEAVETAFAEAATKQWSETAATKLIIHVADAPSHDKDVETWAKGIDALAKKGVRVISLASSGIDKKTEYLYRCQSLYTGGCYIYLTNDSGIGGNHIEATVEEKPVVEYLNACLVRVINGYYTGTFEEPVAYRGQE